MIRPLRQWHRRIMTALAVALPVTFAAALLVRPANVPGNYVGATISNLVYESKSDWHSHRITTRIRKQAGNRVLELDPPAAVLEPDVLVYVSSLPATKSLPVDARLLGPFHPHASYALPQTPSVTTVILYSGARQEVLDTARLGVAP